MNKIHSLLLYRFVWLISLLPYRVLYMISDFFSFLLCYVFKYRKKVIETNLRNSFPEKSDNEISNIRKKFYKHISDYFLETIKLLSVTEKEIKERCKFLNAEMLDKYYNEGKSVLVILGHYANWELMCNYTLWSENIDFMPIYKPLHNKAMDYLYIRMRSRFGAKPLAKNDVFRTLLKYKKEGILSLTAFVGDQTPRKKNIQYWTSFLNQDTPIFLGVDKIAHKLQSPVVFVNMNKVKRGYYEVELIEITEDASELPLHALTETHTRMLENQIKKNPEYWLWSHRRWKHKR
ncbi:MAG: lysophospholipid acyltransferase family protein [Marinifilaceae bacterium]|nr:lysophospholipid acyltransferase family protein [Marinifilaceae bacterium]